MISCFWLLMGKECSPENRPMPLLKGGHKSAKRAELHQNIVGIDSAIHGKICPPKGEKYFALVKVIYVFYILTEIDLLTFV